MAAPNAFPNDPPNTRPNTSWPALLLTRPEAAARRFLGEVEALAGAPLPAILSPILRIAPVAVAPGALTGPAALILTSEAGARRAGELGLGGLAAWCVGPRTAAAAREAGLRPREAGPDAEALLAAILRERPSGPLLHLRGADARGDVAQRLRAAGLDAGEAVAYRAEPLEPTSQARTALDGAAPLVAPLFSPRSARLLAGWAPRARLLVAAMSPAVAAAARRLGPARLVTAARPEGPAMAEATLALLEGAA